MCPFERLTQFHGKELQDVSDDVTVLKDESGSEYACSETNVEPSLVTAIVLL